MQPAKSLHVDFDAQFDDLLTQVAGALQGPAPNAATHEGR